MRRKKTRAVTKAKRPEAGGHNIVPELQPFRPRNAPKGQTLGEITWPTLSLDVYDTYSSD